MTVDYNHAYNFWRKVWADSTGKSKDEFDDWFFAGANPVVRDIGYAGSAPEGTPEWLHQKRQEAFFAMLAACGDGQFG